MVRVAVAYLATVGHRIVSAEIKAAVFGASEVGPQLQLRLHCRMVKEGVGKGAVPACRERAVVDLEIPSAKPDENHAHEPQRHPAPIP